MTRAKRTFIRTFIAVGLMTLCGTLPGAVPAQSGRQELPLVIAGKMPLYPTMARLARIQGVVKIKVKTDGEKVSSLDAESGPPMLVRFAKENILTWEFVKHKPTTFVTTFEYVIEGPDQCIYTNGTSVLNLPLEVRISAKGLMTCDPSTGIKSRRQSVPVPYTNLTNLQTLWRYGRAYSACILPSVVLM